MGRPFCRRDGRLPVFQYPGDLVSAQHLLFQEAFGQKVELVEVLFERLSRCRQAAVDDTLDLGIDFLIMDDTNCTGNDGGRINDNIRAWFDFMDAKPKAERIPICLGGGGEMRAEGRPGQQRAADFYWSTLAQRPSYFRLNGKPLLLVDTDKNYGPGDFEDARFTVRWAYNGDNFRSMAERKAWGWAPTPPHAS